MINFASMKKIALLLLLLPMVCHAYRDHRGRDLDSLERTISHWTVETLAGAGEQDRTEYCKTCRQLAWGYLQVDSPRSVYYAKRAIEVGRISDDQRSIYDASILIGQTFWAKEQYDSARVYYNQASAALEKIEKNWNDPDPHDLEAMQSRLWGTLGNFYASQDSLEQFAYYYGKAGTIFEKWEWWEDCSTLHENIGDFYTDSGDLKKAKPEYDKGLQFAAQSGDSLIIAKAMYGLGRWYHESGKTTKALEYLTKAEEYFGEHAREESIAHSETLAIMNAAHEELYRNAKTRAIGAAILLLLAIGIILVLLWLRRTRKELSETSAVLDETIEELRPAEDAAKPLLNEQERAIARLLVEGKSTKEIAEAVHLGVNTVLWYRKRLYAKLGVHNAAAFSTEMNKRGLLE